MGEDLGLNFDATFKILDATGQEPRVWIEIGISWMCFEVMSFEACASWVLDLLRLFFCWVPEFRFEFICAVSGCIFKLYVSELLHLCRV